MQHFLCLLFQLAVAALALSNTNVFNFPEYPPPGTPPPNATLANSAAPAPYGISDDPALSKAVLHFDTGYFGPQIELVHAYYNYWPTGVAVASTGQIFTCFTRGNETYTLALLNSSTTESAWPDEEWNTPPAFVNTSDPGYSIATDKLLFVQSVVVDGLDRVWALDTGRPRVNGSTLLAHVPGGPKLVGFYLNGTNFATYTFPSYVVYADSSLNDVRFDLRGTGFAYLTDSSPQRPGIVVLDLATGAAWRHLDLHPSVSIDPAFLPLLASEANRFTVPQYLYPIPPPNAITPFDVFAADGIALSSDGAYLYVAPLSSRRLWRVPTALLRVQPSSENPYAFMLARQAVELLGEFGSHADGMETDTDGYIYVGAPEHNSVNRYDPATGLVEPYVRDPVIQWPDTLSIVTLKSGGNYVYFTSNQLWLGPDYQNGTDLRTKPYAMFRAPIAGAKATQTE
ncbi:major royal jelly protein-domain-containing protein [Amylocystis lapponica]|nr:major royal jelly protein-domain-containing protein [Amylocystis lapponica]